MFVLSFRMIPATGRALWVLGGITVLLLALVGMFGYIGLSSRQVKFHVSEEGIEIFGPYGRMIPASSLRTDLATVTDLSTAPDLRPQWRTNGIGLPGYKAGWFRLRSGETALLFVTDETSVVHVPTTEGYSLLLSVAELERFLRAIQELGSAG